MAVILIDPPPPTPHPTSPQHGTVTHPIFTGGTAGGDVCVGRGGGAAGGNSRGWQAYRSRHALLMARIELSRSPIRQPLFGGPLGHHSSDWSNLSRLSAAGAWRLSNMTLQNTGSWGVK